MICLFEQIEELSKILVDQSPRADEGFNVASDSEISTVSPPSESRAEVSETILDAASYVS